MCKIISCVVGTGEEKVSLRNGFAFYNYFFRFGEHIKHETMLSI